jgi:hypothetical protein
VNRGGAEFLRLAGSAADRLVTSVLWLQLQARADGLRSRCHELPAYREAICALLAVGLAAAGDGTRPLLRAFSAGDRLGWEETGLGE